MNTIISIVLLILILCIIILVHELGHFITAKKAGVYVYEFSLGFGPKLKTFKRKDDPTIYSIRAIPLGGFVSMAGESTTEVVDKKVRVEERLCEKSFWWRLTVLLSGVFNNFVLAIIILFVSGLAYGSPETKPIIGTILENGPAYTAGLEKGDTVLKINGESIETIEDLSLEIAVLKNKEEITFSVKKADGTQKDIIIKANVIVEDGVKNYHYGFATSAKRYYGLKESVTYTVNKFDSMLNSMGKTINYIFSGKVSVKELSGPIGIYSIVDASKSGGFEGILYLIAFLSINVGFINLIPVPVFDGGRALLLIIEKIKGDKLSPKVENVLDLIGFSIMIILMVYVTVNDIFKLF